MERINTRYGLFLILTRPGSLLPRAAEAFVAAIEDGADFVYADEAIIYPDGRREVAFKPDPSPDTLLSYDYIGSPVAVSETLYTAAGAMEHMDERERYAFILRAFFMARRVTHIPVVLFEGPKPSPVNDPAVVIRQVLLLETRKRASVIAPGLYPQSAQVIRGVPPKTLCSVIVGGNDADRIHATLRSVEMLNTYPSVELILCPDESGDGRLCRYCRALKANKAAAIVKGEQLNEAARRNLASNYANGEVLLFLEAGTRLAVHDAIERLMGQALRKEIGCAGGKVVTSGGTLVHTGLTLCAADQPRSLYAGRGDSFRHPIQNAWTNCIRNVSGVGYALAIRANLFHAARGFDETLTMLGAEGELGLKCLRAGKRNVYDPGAKFVLDALENCNPDERTTFRMTDVYRCYRINGDPFVTTSSVLFPR